MAAAGAVARRGEARVGVTVIIIPCLHEHAGLHLKFILIFDR